MVSEGAANLVHETQDLVEPLMSGRRFEVRSSLLPWRRRVASRVIVTDTVWLDWLDRLVQECVGFFMGGGNFWILMTFDLQFERSGRLFLLRN